MVRFPRLPVVGALTLLAATGCAAGSHHRTAVQPAGKFPIVVARPNVQSSGLPSGTLRRLRGNRAILLSPSRVAFVTTGSSSCAWWPARLTVLGPSTIRVDMRVNGRVTACTGGAVGFPIAVKIDPRIIDVRRPLTVRLAYKVRLCCAQGTKRWTRTADAPALSRS